MCGIVAEHGACDPAALERMLERIAHRGPDERGSVQVDSSWLGHRRLSIVDVEGGAQPLHTAQADAFLVGNGDERPFVPRFDPSRKVGHERGRIGALS